MNKADYNQMIQAQEAQVTNAWRFVFDKWNCREWESLPQNVKALLHLPANIGVCSGMLVTKAGAEGVNEFIARMNRVRC